MKDGEMERKGKQRKNLHSSFIPSLEEENHCIGNSVFVCVCVHTYKEKKRHSKETLTQGQKSGGLVGGVPWSACVETDGKLSAYCSFISGGEKNITIYLGWETLYPDCNRNLFYCHGGAVILAINGSKCSVTIRRVETSTRWLGNGCSAWDWVEIG